LRIRLLNWRDPKSPRAGGAETLTHEIASRLVQRGHEVTWFASRPAGLAGEEELDGVRIVRRGSELTTRFFAARFARRARADVLVEEINTLPYFSPLWSRIPALLFIPQLAREVWWYEAPRLLAPLGYAAEPVYLRPYRKTRTITISASTREDLRRLGFRREIDVIPIAVSSPVLAELPPKTPTGRLVIVGRLVPSKRVLEAVRTLDQLRASHPEATLAVVGSGPELGALEHLVGTLGLQDAVSFHGRVSEEDKARILGESDVLVATAAREGWGLTVTEAARLGVPAAVYDVPGLRDSVVDGGTGVLSASRPQALAAAIASLLDDPALYSRLREAAWLRACELSWDRTVDAFEQAVAAEVR
jgi:glycosyltransferase involved in cell wall biosynthesis